MKNLKKARTAFVDTIRWLTRQALALAQPEVSRLALVAEDDFRDLQPPTRLRSRRY